MPKHTSAANPTPVRVVLVSLDTHLAGAAERIRPSLQRELPGLSFALHAASEWENDPDALEKCRADIAEADIIIATMLFMEDHIQAVLPDLQARRDNCDAILGCMSAGEIMRLTRVGGFTMDGSQKGPLSLLKKLRGSKKSNSGNSGAKQMAMLRRIPRILRFIPGTAQDVRAYFLTLQYWLSGSEENLANMVRFLINQYADGPRRSLRGTLKPESPTEYPEVGTYHPHLKGRISDRRDRLPKPANNGPTQGTVGLLIMRSYVLAGNTDHYDSVIRALEHRGLQVVPAFASGLDARPAIDAYFRNERGHSNVDAIVSLTGFSLIGGPAYNDSEAAQQVLAELDVPYLAAQAVEFQSLGEWGESERGLMPVEATMMVAIPELDGSTTPMVFGGRASTPGTVCQGCDQGCSFDDTGNSRDMRGCPERAEVLASRAEHLIRLRSITPAERKLAIVLFNFPPNAGNTGTAAHLSVFASLHHTLTAMRANGYQVEVPETVDALRARLVEGNAAQYGTHANVHTRIPAEAYVRGEPWLKDIESQWGPAPGRQQSDGSHIFVLGAQFGNVFVGIQPAFGYEGDPMRLLFEKGFAPTHAFSAFYRYIRDQFAADAVLHFGTHGALEFMPGKQAGLSERDWPDRLIRDLPNFYLYASNNPSEGTIAKRRAAATLISYLTPPVANAGLYRGLVELKGSIDRWRLLPPETSATELDELLELIQAQAAAVDLASEEPAWTRDEGHAEVARLTEAVLELEYTLIPHGLHVVGEAPSEAERIDMLGAVAQASHGAQPSRESLTALVSGQSPESAAELAANGPEPEAVEADGTSPEAAASAPAGLSNPTDRLAMFQELAKTDSLLMEDHEIDAILQALEGRFIRPAPGGDLLRNPDILPTGRNLHGFDPYRIPSPFAVTDGARQAALLLERHTSDGGSFPETIAFVLWGTDNLKTEGGPIAQALYLMGARPRVDGYGRLAGADLIPLEELGRPRIDVVMTLSGIFRDLLPLQTRMLAEAALAAAEVDEPTDWNFIRKHVLAYQAEHSCDRETAALRVFSNADGAYGSNVNHLIDSSSWEDEDELAETYTRRKCYAYGRQGKPVRQAELLQNMLTGVELTYQNLDSVELGVTTVDHYFDTLGGISRSVHRARGEDVPVYIGDQTQGDGKIRTLGEQVALETRTRMLNPKWYEGMLKHGYEGVRQIEVHITNTMGWSATTGNVAPWVYQRLSETFVLDEAMRERLANLNPTASVKMANRLIEAQERNYWQPDEEMLEALRRAGEELEDRLEGVTSETTDEVTA